MKYSDVDVLVVVSDDNKRDHGMEAGIFFRKEQRFIDLEYRDHTTYEATCSEFWDYGSIDYKELFETADPDYSDGSIWPFLDLVKLHIEQIQVTTVDEVIQQYKDKGLSVLKINGDYTWTDSFLTFMYGDIQIIKEHYCE